VFGKGQLLLTIQFGEGGTLSNGRSQPPVCCLIDSAEIMKCASFKVKYALTKRKNKRSKNIAENLHICFLYCRVLVTEVAALVGWLGRLRLREIRRGLSVEFVNL